MKAHRKVIPIAILLMLFGTSHVLANEILARENGCFECHGLDKKVVGPGFNDIAAKYKNNNIARNLVIEKIKNGSKGDWNEISNGVPMPPYSPRISDANIHLLTDWILQL